MTVEEACKQTNEALYKFMKSRIHAKSQMVSRKLTSWEADEELQFAKLERDIQLRNIMEQLTYDEQIQFCVKSRFDILFNMLSSEQQTAVRILR